MGLFCFDSRSLLQTFETFGSKTMIALWWEKTWVPTEDFLTVDGAGDELREVCVCVCV